MSRPPDRETLWQEVQQNENFQTLVRKRSRFALTLAAIMLSLYMAFILLIAFAPGVLGTPLAPGAVTTLGIPVGLGLILIAIALTGLYVYRANGEFDRLNARVLEEIEK